MKTKASPLVLLMTLLHLMDQALASPHYNAYSNNIETCLFQAWQSGSKAVLSGPVNCNDKVKQFQLCYGTHGKDPAEFVVCYNNETLIPDFTGHLVEPGISVTGRTGCSWHDEGGEYAPKPASSINDYKINLQGNGLYPNNDTTAEQYITRGHLTPNLDFCEFEKRQITFINTNIAPQWMLFNSFNWDSLEKAVRAYATSVQRAVHVFTGAGGEAKNSNNNPIKLNNKVIVPKYFWKAICDPGINGSVVFVAENPIGNIASTHSPGCNNITQTTKYGVVQCYSLDEVSSETGHFASANFVLPPFHGTNCAPSKRGTFMDGHLNFQ